ncbi:MAG TPA: ATP-binding cassette domain-containing protein, partial [Egibacteraceae bacterium]|nr:ATP-binding cassette domain-containing protein [Egibacteraceae bacterium]
MSAVLTVEDLRVRFGTKRGVAEVVSGIGYTLHEAETLAIVGESGSGKSVSSLALMGLVPQPPGKVTGTVHFGGRNLVECSREQLRHIRGNDIAMIFQDALSALNPVFTVGFQLAELFRKHRGMSRADSKVRAV